MGWVGCSEGRCWVGELGREADITRDLHNHREGGERESLGPRTQGRAHDDADGWGKLQQELAGVGQGGLPWVRNLLDGPLQVEDEGEASAALLQGLQPQVPLWGGCVAWHGVA
jgi:hypothetical protein